MSLFTDKIEVEIAEAELGTKNLLGQFPRAGRWLLILAVLAIIPSYYISRSLALKYWQARLAPALTTAKASFTDAQPPVVSATTLIPAQDGSYTAVVKITNPNIDLSLNLTPFRLNFYNSSKQLVASADDKIYLLPNQEKYFIAAKITPASPIDSVTIDLPAGSLHWQKKFNLPQVNFVTAVPQTSQQVNPPAFVVESSVVNNSPYKLGQVTLYFILLDSQQKIIAASQRDEFNLAPFERRAFKQLWPGFLPALVSQVKIIPDTNTLDKTNLSVPAAAGSASDLNRPQ